MKKISIYGKKIFPRDKYKKNSTLELFWNRTNVLLSLDKKIPQIIPYRVITGGSYHWGIILFITGGSQLFLYHTVRGSCY